MRAIRKGPPSTGDTASPCRGLKTWSRSIVERRLKAVGYQFPNSVQGDSPAAASRCPWSGLGRGHRQCYRTGRPDGLVGYKIASLHKNYYPAGDFFPHDSGGQHREPQSDQPRATRRRRQQPRGVGAGVRAVVRMMSRKSAEPLSSCVDAPSRPRRIAHGRHVAYRYALSEVAKARSYRPDRREQFRKRSSGEQRCLL
jgi:hypothetical protein